VGRRNTTISAWLRNERSYIVTGWYRTMPKALVDDIELEKKSYNHTS
jgi:hypothetical protein